MNFLKRYGAWVVFIGTLPFLFNYFYKESCEEAISYKIGRVDPGFNLSTEKLLSSVEGAEKLWETPIQRQLFTYNPEGDLTINLIYDDRQKTTQQNAELKADVDKTSKLASSLKQEYESLTQNLNASKQIYNDELERFTAKQKAYETQVEYWNSEGGAPPAEYTALQEERNALEREREVLENKRLTMNEMVDKINAFIQKYNLLVKNTNANIRVINESAGQEFQEGTYDPKTNTITIYEFSTQDKLTRVLAHELGHALGLNHNENPSSIMYALNQSNTLTLSKEDVASLKALCKEN